ncbi:MAG TPA: DUF523 and DUF1722 domain-containing protein [Candidatus Limnocylindrales bacterium]|nr:DUF523 and DUF1722 domain-containing protein [Candidatus Limnocylindrales bacterium]
MIPAIRIGISSCLLGARVRFDGGHKKDPFITETLGKFFQWIPVCPEIEMGLGTPRESLRLVDTLSTPHLIAPHSKTDLTEIMACFAEKRLEELAQLNLHGYILKKDSPSCGMERVRVYGEKGAPQRKGRGLFAEALIRRFPLLPIEEEGRLQDLRLRENFIERVFSYYRWTELLRINPEPKDLIRFHTQHKLTLLSHSREYYQKLGRLVAQTGKIPMQDLLREYGELFMTALKVKVTTKKHVDVLYHLLGFLKKVLDSQDKAELISYLEDYRKGLVPLIVPITLLRHHLRHHPIPWVLEQTYLNPYPAELMLRNHV